MTEGRTVAVPPECFPVLGMIGGGQLARMTHQAAISLGIGFAVLGASREDSAARVVADTVVGDPDRAADVAGFAAQCDVVTFDHEQVPPPVLAALTEQGAVMRPSPQSLVYAQDKVAMRRAMERIGVPCPRWLVWSDVGSESVVGERLGWPSVVKVSRGGYDGRGVWVVPDEESLSRVVRSEPPPGAEWLVESFVPFSAELAAQVCRSPHGQAVAYPVVRTVQESGICREVVAPAPGLPDDLAVAAQEIALRVARELDVTGMLTVEMFLADDRVLVNELAMRPHNSGHWTIEGAVTSQFENHARAVLDLPLGSPRAKSDWTVMVNVLGGRDPDLYGALRHCMARDPELRVHLYGKEIRPGRKVGHVTVAGSDLTQLLERAHHAADYLTGSL